MADENDIAASVHEEGLDFAQMITGDDTPPTEGEKPPVEEQKPPVEEEKPPVEEEKPPVTEEEDENPFKVEPKEGETKPEEDKDPEKPTSKDDWSRLRESRDKHKAVAAERESLLREKEAQIEEFRAKAARTAELEEKLKVFDEQEKELALARVESTREYKETIDAPLKAIGAEAEALTKENEADFEPIRLMLLEPDRSAQRIKLKELTAGWDDVDRQELKKMADDARTLLDKQDAMRTNAHATAKEQQQIAAQREAEQKEASKKAFAAATTDVVKSLREKTPFVPLVEGQTEDDHFSALAQKVAAVDFDALPPNAKALAAASTFELIRMTKQDALRVAEIASLKEALAKATKDKPSVITKPETEEAGSEGKDFFDEMGIPQPKHMFGMV